MSTQYQSAKDVPTKVLADRIDELSDAARRLRGEASTVRRVVDYKILHALNFDVLADLAKESIEEGWQPLGGISVSLSEADEYRYEAMAQAVVRYSDD